MPPDVIRKLAWGTAGGLALLSCGDVKPSALDEGAPQEALHADLIDASSACFGMHCCPSGYGMRGLRADSNLLLCRQVNQSHEDCFVDYATYRSSMHACPAGTYLRGVHVDRNLLTCCYERERGYSEFTTETSDTSHVEFDMHACPAPASDAFMTGVNVAQNRFLCGTARVAPSPITNPVNITLNPEAPRTFANFVPATPLATWQAAMRNWLSRIFNLPINKSYLTVPSIQTVETVAVERGVTRKKVRYPSLVDGQMMSAYLFLPPGYVTNGSYRAAIVTHGHSSEAKAGAGALWDSAYHASALYLAQNGFVALAPDTRSWGEYRPLAQDHDTYTATLKAQTGYVGALPQMTLLDNLRHVTVLGSTAGVDKAAIYSEGLSLGADQSMWLSAIDTRIAKAIPAGLFIGFACLNDPTANHECQTVRSLSTNMDDPSQSLLFDAGDVAGLIAPRPLYAMWGDQDGFFWQTPTTGGARCSQTAASTGQAAYTTVGAISNFRLSPLPGMGHELDTTTALAFFTGQTPADQLDYGTACNDMHCCPAGKAMGGVHIGRNDFICRDMIPAAHETCIVDGGTQRANMHACPTGMYMRGLHVDHNLLTCCHDASTGPQAFARELVDPTGGAPVSQSQGMHVCPTSATTMTGLHVDSNLLLCGGR